MVLGREARQRFALASGIELGNAKPRFESPRAPINRLVLTDLVDTKQSRTLAETPTGLELAAIPHAIFVIGANGRIEDVNARAELLVGYTRAQLVGELMTRMVSDSAGSPIAHPARHDVRVQFVPGDAGVCVHHRSGRDFPVEVLLCHHERGSLVAQVNPLSVVDHGDLRESDVAEIVHDLKNPLATIALEMCLLDEKLDDPGHADLRAAVSRVRYNVAFLDRMVQDLLDSRAIDAGQFAVQRKPTELHTLLEQVIDRMIATRDRGRVFLKAASRITLSIDDLKIERVVANFLQNALKYAPRSSEIVVRLDAIPGLARVSVIDAGPGMTPDEKTYIFDKYRRASCARAHEGSGLGLYISKQIIDAHGGRIGVDDLHGLGSRFFFELPVT